MGSCIFALNNPLAARHLAFHGFLWAIMQMKINPASEKKKFKLLKFVPRFLNRMSVGSLHLTTNTKSIYLTIIGEYSPIITEPEGNNCFSLNTQVIISKKRKKNFNAKSPSLNSGKTTTGSHFVRRGDYRLIIRDSEPMRARDFVNSDKE